ncbi:conserved exported hypothetical protein [Bradyrhizobium sp. ORS 375]|uniref:DUF6719 family protein n=1 Tax=Bradyrhizobium sp. (strain ORS 375) TaxID=566679 RepID=UPI000240A17C|nr:DUF6719 family protein [Bradyrhizobium sp. ORS 375]CCD92823.1 conserved exported hypothetical protein [Bradyrhizobium sp. ORS 375]
MRFEISLSPDRAAQCLGAVAVVVLLATPARAQYVGREQDITDLRLGQRVQVDDGTCPAGQVKEVLGSRMSEAGIVRTTTCVPRFGPKKK